MSYIRGQTLSDAWPELTPQHKESIQGQLNDIFSTIRTLRQADGHQLGSVNGEGAKDMRMVDRRSNKAITSAADFENFQFSNSMHASISYIHLLRGLLPGVPKGSIFTHGDVRPANILVEMTDSGDFVVTGTVLPTRKPLRPPSRLGRQQDSYELAGASHHNPLASSVALVCEQITSILAARRPCK
jgi:hypothetical protein